MPAEYFARGPPRAPREETLRNIRRAPRRDDSTAALLRQRENAPLRGAPRREPSRRTQESRSRAARERLLSATIEVLIDRGYNGLTTKEVSGRAGLSNGALVHHYGTKAELVIAATEQVYDRCIENGEKIANSDKARKHPLQAYIDDCLHVYLGWPFLAAVEVLVPARTDQTLMVQVDKFMQHYRHTMNDVWLAAFQRAGINRNDVGVPDDGHAEHDPRHGHQQLVAEKHAALQKAASRVGRSGRVRCVRRQAHRAALNDSQ